MNKIPLTLTAVLVAVLMVSCNKEDNPIAPDSTSTEVDDLLGMLKHRGIISTQSFDIYSIDVKTSKIRQISSISNADEFDPNWSPNGKKIAHDVVGGPAALGHAIFITSVKTGQSSPLQGAEGGNDASWSPNGRLIAFDNAPVSDPPNIYVVRASGGSRRLIRAGGLSLDWSPDGKRLVFMDREDDVVKTISLKDGTETTVFSGLPSGSEADSPVWSPHGKWIAFSVVESNGIWKVRVDKAGNPVGNPIQVTSGEHFKPSWSKNSKKIAFHADGDIWTVSASGGTPTRLTNSAEDDFDPSFAKRRRLIAFASFTP